METLIQTIVEIARNLFQTEVSLFLKLQGINQLIYVVYLMSGVPVGYNHYRQYMAYVHGNSGKGGFCYATQLKSVAWRLPPLLFSITVIDSKLMFLAVVIDIVGRLLVIWGAHMAHLKTIPECSQFEQAANVCGDNCRTPSAVSRLGIALEK